MCFFVTFKFQAEAASKSWYVVYGLKNSPKGAKCQMCACTNSHTHTHTLMMLRHAFEMDKKGHIVKTTKYFHPVKDSRGRSKNNCSATCTPHSECPCHSQFLHSGSRTSTHSSYKLRFIFSLIPYHRVSQNLSKG